MPSKAATTMTREEKKSRTRQALLGAAAKLVARDGAQATSLDRIAEEAGLTKGAVYSNFDSKEDLLFTLAETAGGPEVNLDPILEAAGSLADGLEEAGRAVARELGSVPSRSFRLGLEVFNFALRNSRARKRQAANNRANMQATGEQFERLARGWGKALPMAGEELATVVQALALGLAQQRALDPKAVPDELFARAFRLLAGSP